MSATLAALLLPLCLLGSAFFSATETALFSLDARGRERAGATARRLMRDPPTVLVGVLLGNLLVNVLFFALLPDAFPGAGGPGDAGGWLRALAGLATVLTLGELLPKSIALRAPVGVARLGALPLSIVLTLFGPLQRALRFLLEVALRALGNLARPERGIQSEELFAVLEASAAQGLIELGEADLLAEIVELSDIRVREIMTPRVDLLFLDLNEPLAAQRATVERAVERRLTRLTVVRGQADEVAGSVRVKSLLAEPDRPLAELLRPVAFVPEVASLLDLLRFFRDRRAAWAIVVDEHGGTSGSVTIEDVAEEIVGELRVEGEPEAPQVVDLGDGRFRVPGALAIRDWNERFGLRVVPDGFETVGGFVVALLGRIPRAGDRARSGALLFRVHEVRGRRVKSVDVSVDPAGSAGA